MNDLVERIRCSRDRFIYYYRRGEENKHYHRPISIYRLWAFEGTDTLDGKMDCGVLDVWVKVVAHNPTKEDEPGAFERVLGQFDIMEKYAKIWIFS